MRKIHLVFSICEMTIHLAAVHKLEATILLQWHADNRSIMASARCPKVLSGAARGALDDSPLTVI